MSDFEKNNPLGIAAEGLLQTNDPIAPASGGILHSAQDGTYVAQVEVVVGVTNAHELSYEIPTLNIETNIDCTALYSFVPATQEKERGGRGAYTSRRPQVQTHTYLWDVPLRYADAIAVTALADSEFIKGQKYFIITSLPKVDLPHIVNKAEPRLFNHVANVKVESSVSAHVSVLDYVNVLRREEDDLLTMLLGDSYDDQMFVTTTYDMFGDKNRKEEETLLRMLDII